MINPDSPASEMTIRAKIAAKALEGLMRHPDSVGEAEDVVANWAVKAADALIDELNKQP